MLSEVLGSTQIVGSDSVRQILVRMLRRLARMFLASAATIMFWLTVSYDSDPSVRRGSEADLSVRLAHEHRASEVR